MAQPEPELEPVTLPRSPHFAVEAGKKKGITAASPSTKATLSAASLHYKVCLLTTNPFPEGLTGARSNLKRLFAQESWDKGLKIAPPPDGIPIKFTNEIETIVSVAWLFKQAF